MFGISVWKSDKPRPIEGGGNHTGWWANIPNGICPKDGFKHNMKKNDCVFIPSLRPIMKRYRGNKRILFEYGVVDKVEKDGTINAKYVEKSRSADETFYNKRINQYFPVYEEGEITKEVVTTQLPEELKIPFHNRFIWADIDKCYELSPRNKNTNENWIEDLKISV